MKTLVKMIAVMTVLVSCNVMAKSRGYHEYMKFKERVTHECGSNMEGECARKVLNSMASGQKELGPTLYNTNTINELISQIPKFQGVVDRLGMDKVIEIFNDASNECAYTFTIRVDATLCEMNKASEKINDIFVKQKEEINNEILETGMNNILNQIKDFLLNSIYILGLIGLGFKIFSKKSKSDSKIYS